jgi:hypothetical protein
VRDREFEDEDGVVHTGDDVLAGEAFEQGPVVLAWNEVEASGRGEGFNVVVHEFAHKLSSKTPPQPFEPEQDARITAP